MTGDLQRFAMANRSSLGNTRVKVLHTPGHSPHSVCLLVTDLKRGAQPWFVLTGDTLFVGAVGRPDLPGRVRENAAELYASIHDKRVSAKWPLDIDRIRARRFPGGGRPVGACKRRHTRSSRVLLPVVRTTPRACATPRKSRFRALYPRDRWFVRVGIWLENALRCRSGNPFREFVHSPSEMIGIIEAAGFRLASRRRTPAWSSDVFVSTSESTDGDRQWHTS